MTVAGFPKEFARVTKHKTPRYQFYRPGFNPVNSCWLVGSWETVSKTEYDSFRLAQLSLGTRIFEETKKQSYKGEATAISDLDFDQREAYNRFSGSLRLDCIVNGRAQGVSVEMAGNKLSEVSLKWMRDQGYKVAKRTKMPGGDIIEQLTGLDFPEDVVDPSEEPFDFWGDVVKQNKARSKGMFQSMTRAAKGFDPMPGEFNGENFQDFSLSMAVHQLIEAEEEIIRHEWGTTVGRIDPFATLAETVAEYVEMRTELEEAPQFLAVYEEAHASHNNRERTILDNSDGRLFGFVLPKFNADGSHEPWGSRDVPWNSPKDDDNAVAEGVSA